MDFEKFLNEMNGIDGYDIHNNNDYTDIDDIGTPKGVTFIGKNKPNYNKYNEKTDSSKDQMMKILINLSKDKNAGEKMWQTFLDSGMEFRDFLLMAVDAVKAEKEGRKF